MPVHIEFDDAAIGGLCTAMRRAAATTAELVLGDVRSAQVMPFDTGDMQNASTYVENDAEGDEAVNRIVTSSPQARRLYFHPEYSFQQGKNTNAGGEWLQPWLDGDRSDFVTDTYAEQFKKEAGL